MSIGDYGNKPTINTNTKTTDATKIHKKDDFSPTSIHASDPKASAVSQAILAKTQTNSDATTKMLDHHTKHHENSVNNGVQTPQAKAEVVSSPILAKSTYEENPLAEQLRHADLQRMSSINGNGSLTRSKFDSMTKEALSQALDNPHITEKEIDEILAKLDELQKNNNIQESKKIQKIEAPKLSSLKLNIKNLRILSEDGKFKLPTPDDEDFNAESFCHIDAQSGVVHLSEQLAQRFAVGQHIEVENETGGFSQVEIRQINVMDEKQVESLRSAYILYQNNLNQSLTDDKQVHGGSPQQQTLGAVKEGASVQTNTKANAQQKQDTPTIPAAGLVGGKSKKELDEKRIMEFIEYMDKKLEIIKHEITKHETINEGIKDNNLEKAIASSNVDLKELHAANNKLDAEYKNLMKTLRDGSGNEIPLATVIKFQKLEISFQQIAKMNPDAAKQPEFLKETISMKKEVMKVLKDTINTSGVLTRTGIGHTGKNTNG